MAEIKYWVYLRTRIEVEAKDEVSAENKALALIKPITGLELRKVGVYPIVEKA